MKRGMLLLAGIFLFFSSIAQIPAGYYDLAAGKSGETLRAALRDITTNGHVKLPYTSASFDVWNAYAVTDVRPAPNNTIVWDMYSDIPSGSPAYTFTIYTNQCGTASGEGDCYSREHCMPNSWWGGIDDDANPQYTDLHHLFPADQYVNSRKNNYIVGQTSTPTWTSTNGSKLGPCTFPGYTGTVFEPINEYKGDFARAYLYLATRYMNELSDWVTTYSSYDSKYIINTTGGNYKQWYIDMLISWHNSDPVSQKEIDRNNNIYYNTPQHNRNPYIDHPEYVCQVWGCSTSPTITGIVNTPAAPNSANTVSVSANVTDNISVTSVTLQWCTNGTSFGNSITMNVSGAPNYVTASPIPAQPTGTTVTYRIVAVDNDANSTTSVAYSYNVVKNEPTNYPTSLSTGTSTSTSITLNWTDASAAVTPDGYLIKASAVSLAAITDPIDGNVVANSLLIKNVAQGLQTIKFSGLNPATTYYFKIYPYTNSLANINYKTSATPPSISGTTLAGGTGSCATDLIISEYVEGSSNNKYLEISNNTGVVVDLSDYELRPFNNGSFAIASFPLTGTLNDQSTIVYKNTSATIYSGTTTTSGAINFNGNDAIALYKVSTSSYVDIFGRIGEDPGTAWTSGSFTTINKTLVRNASVTSGVTTNPASGFPTLATEWTQYNQDDVSHLGAHTMTCATCSAPTVKASNVTFASVNQTSMTINWTNGNGSNRIVLMHQGVPISGVPTNGISYAANSAFGLGDELSPDEFVVYNNSGSSVTVSNLIAGQTYYISIFEYNCIPGAEIYLTPAITSSQITCSLSTGTTPNSKYCVTSSTGSATTIGFTSTGSFTGNTYTAQLSNSTGSFASPVTIGSLTSNLNSGTINCTIPANTASGTGYLIRVISSGPSITGTNSNSFEISLYTPPTAPTSALTSRDNFCEDDGGTIDLSVTGGSGTTLSWYTSSCGGTLIGTGSPLSIASPTSTTTYYARWENSCGSSVCTSVTVNVKAKGAASILIDASANPTCQGTSVTFTATPTNGGITPSYQWQLNGADIVGQTNSTYSSSSLATADQVKCIMTSSETCVSGSPATSNTITMTVSSDLHVSVSIGASANPACVGSSVIFTATPTNVGNTPSYQWKLNGLDVIGQTGSTYSSSTLVTSDQVKCILTSNDACASGSPATSNTITMTVNPVLTASVSIATSANPVCVGTSVTFTATPVNGGSTPAYQWKLNGSDIVSQTNSTYSYSSLATADQVKCIMTSSETCVSGSPATSNTVTLTINPLPSDAGIISGITAVCQGQNSVTYSVPQIGNATSYLWTLPTGVTGTSSTNEITVNYGLTTVLGNIIVKGNNGCGNGAESILAITVKEKPVTPIIELYQTTKSGYYLHSNTATGNQWYNLTGLLNNATEQMYAVLSGGTYYDIVTINGCSSDPSNSLVVVLSSIDNPSNNKSIEIYPNPVSNELVIEIKGSTRKTGFEILNSSGNNIFKGSLLEKITIQTANFPSGLYVIKLEDGKSFIFKKFIKE
ncbi:MAG: endonuclease [Bacteroidales bacterium]|nr:endonuclease [Bacteroidales bacterium]